MSEPKTCLILGAGFAGLGAARELAGSDLNVVVVDPKDYFAYVPSAPINLLDARSAASSCVPYPASLARKQGQVVGISTDGARGEATLASGEKLPFDYALLSVGSTYPSAIKPAASVHDRAARLAELAAVTAQLEAAASVVVVGGGTVGVEVAAEVAEKHPSKKVTLVAPGGLVARMDPKARAFAADWMAKHGVEVVDERISDWGGVGDGPPAAATLVTASGRSLSADLVFKCVGFYPVTAAGPLAASLGAARAAPGGAVAVEPTLQVVGWPNVFCAGDCAGVAGEKTAALAGMVGQVAAQNILRLRAGTELQRYPECLFGAPPVVQGGFTLGAKAGAFQMGSQVQLGGAPATIKAVFGWMYCKVVAGNRFLSWLYRQMAKSMVSTLAKEANKAAAASGAAGAAPVAAAAPA